MGQPNVYPWRRRRRYVHVSRVPCHFDGMLAHSTWGNLWVQNSSDQQCMRFQQDSNPVHSKHDICMAKQEWGVEWQSLKGHTFKPELAWFRAHRRPWHFTHSGGSQASRVDAYLTATTWKASLSQVQRGIMQREERDAWLTSFPSCSSPIISCATSLHEATTYLEKDDIPAQGKQSSFKLIFCQTFLTH